MTPSPDRLERYRDFIDPEHTEVPYNPRMGLERLLGVLSPDPKGIVLVAMGEDWYEGFTQLQHGVFSFLERLGLKPNIWPLTLKGGWNYIERKNRNNTLITDGSLVEIGAVVKRIEPVPFKLFYQRSLAGVELSVPLIQQAIEFVVKAREFAERQRLIGKEPPKFDSMWRIVGSIQSSTDQRRPLGVYDVIDFLVHHSGRYRERDLEEATKIPQSRLAYILPSLGNCGVIDYISPKKEREGQRPKGWSVYTIVDPQAVAILSPEDIYQSIRSKTKHFGYRSALTKIVDYIKEHPNDEFEYNTITKQLVIMPTQVIWILSLLAKVNILQRPQHGFRGARTQTVTSANDYSHLFHDLVCDPIAEVANTLSPLSLRVWDKRAVATYLQNFEEERSNIGQQGGIDARELLVKIIPANGGGMKLSHIVDSYNEIAERELKSISIGVNLQILISMGLIEESRPGYYRLVQK